MVGGGWMGEMGGWDGGEWKAVSEGWKVEG